MTRSIVCPIIENTEEANLTINVAVTLIVACLYGLPDETIDKALRAICQDVLETLKTNAPAQSS